MNYGKCLLTHHQGPLSLHLLLHIKVTRRGSILPFNPTRGQKPAAVRLGQELSLSSLPTKQSAAALPSTGAPALSTLVSLDTDVLQPVEGPTHNQTAPQGAIRLCPSLYNLAKTPIVYDQLSFELQSYPFESDRLLLLNGFKFGFSLQYTGLRMYREVRNLKSAREAPDLVEQKLDKEVALGRVAGPFESIPFPTFRVSPVGLVPKKDGDVRLIHHLSYPMHDSVNYHIDSDICTVKYSNIDEAVLMIQNLGQGTLLAKTDLKAIVLS